MSHIETIAPADARDTVAEMYRRQQDSWGYVPNYAKVFSHRPEVLARWGQLLAEIKRSMDPRRFELVTFAAAHELRNSPCTLAHGRALRAFYDDGQIIAIARQRTRGVLDEADAALAIFARQVARDASAVTRADVERLRDLGWTDAEVFDAAAAAAGRAFFTKLLDALGVTTDSPFLAMQSPLREALTVGAPIDPAEPQRMPDASAVAQT